MARSGGFMQAPINSTTFSCRVCRQFITSFLKSFRCSWLFPSISNRRTATSPCHRPRHTFPHRPLPMSSLSSSCLKGTSHSCRYWVVSLALRLMQSFPQRPQLGRSSNSSSSLSSPDSSWSCSVCSSSHSSSLKRNGILICYKNIYSLHYCVRHCKCSQSVLLQKILHEICHCAIHFQNLFYFQKHFSPESFFALFAKVTSS